MGTPRTGPAASIARPLVPLHGPFVLPAPPNRSPDLAEAGAAWAFFGACAGARRDRTPVRFRVGPSGRLGPCPTSSWSPRSSPPATSRRRSSASSDGLARGLRHQVLLGATGTGQDVHPGAGHPEGQPADARPGPQQDPGRPALRRVPRVLPEQRRRVLRQLLRLLPAGGVPAPVRHVHREGLAAATRRSTGSATRRPTRSSSGATSSSSPRSAASTASARRSTTGPPSCASSAGRQYRRDAVLRHLVDLQYQRNDQALQRARFRVRGDTLELSPGVRGPPRPGRVLRRRGRADHRARPADRRAARRAEGGQRLPGEPLRDPGRQAAGGDRRHRGRDGGARRPARGRGPGARGRAAPPADDVRPRDDARARVLLRDRELLAPPLAARGRARGRGRCSTTSRRTGCSSSTSRT